MLTDTQVQVLAAVNDHLEIHGRMEVEVEKGLAPLLADLGLPTGEVLQALGDLHELDCIEGVMVAEFDYPVLITRVTAKGRRELP